MPAQERVDARLQRWSVVPLAIREKDDADAELVARREPLAGGDELLEESARSGEEQPGAVAGVLDCAAAMLDAGETREREIDQLAACAGRVRDGADSTTASSWMISESARDAHGAGSTGVRSSFGHRASFRAVPAAWKSRQAACS